MERTVKNLSDDSDTIDVQDFLDRADILGALGKAVLVSNYAEYHRLAAYLFRHTKRMIGIVMGAPTLREIFDEELRNGTRCGSTDATGPSILAADDVAPLNGSKRNHGQQA